LLDSMTALQDHGIGKRFRTAIGGRWALAALLGGIVAGATDPSRVARAAEPLNVAGVADAPPAVPVIERALVIHDSSKGSEHLIEELTFAAGDKPLGLLLPVPARPTVAKLTSSPFAKLAAGATAATGSGFGSSGPDRLGGAPQPSADADAAQVGRLTTSVLSADDSSALKKWLVSNKFASDPASDAWLARYAGRGFYFVALRIEPKAKKDALTTVTETLQISFASPLPFFPYTESLENLGLRQLSVWLLASNRQVPVVLGSTEGQARWLRPWHELESSQPTPKDLSGMLPKALVALLPRGTVQLQHFEDQKSSRLGYGDIVLVPETPQATPPKPSPELRRLMSVVDPEVKP
jgi:hypothetical protein